MLTALPPREEFIQDNLGLVHLCASRFKGRGIEYDDLYSAGCIGLVKAYDGFDVERKVCFSTYAVPVILGEIKKLFREGGTVKVSRGLKELSLKVTAVREKMLKQTGREPTVSEMAAALKVTEEQVVQAVNASLPALSLTPVTDDENGREFDVPVPSHEEELSDRLALREVLEDLPLDDKRLIALRFFNGKTQSETAKYLGTTQVQISRRERKILLALRARLLR